MTKQFLDLMNKKKFLWLKFTMFQIGVWIEFCPPAGIDWCEKSFIIIIGFHFKDGLTTFIATEHYFSPLLFM